MIKFFVDPSAIQGSNIYMENPSDCRHLIRVLRKKVGDHLLISDGLEWEYETEIQSIEDNSIVLKIVDKQKSSSEPRLRVTLYQGVPKSSKMETVIQKTVEMGIDTIIPVFMERTVVVEKGNFSKKLERWQKISDEAVKQCKRTMIPEVQGSLDFATMVSQLKNYDLVICPYENEKNQTLKDCLQQVTQRQMIPRTVAVIIGPEGGFSQKEISCLEELDIPVHLVTLGKTILRTETAGLVALSMLMYEFEL